MPDPERPTSPPPVPKPEDDGEDGVDVTLVRWTLSLSPQERLEVLQANVDALIRLRDGPA